MYVDSIALKVDSFGKVCNEFQDKNHLARSKIKMKTLSVSVIGEIG